MIFWLFALGLAVGSFLNVISLRYKAGGHLFTADVLKGRSHCPYCQKTLRWFELVPLLSFAIQMGRCRHCRHSLTWQYPIVEVITASVFAFVPVYVQAAPIWIVAILVLILIALIDARLSVIPDQLNLFLLFLGFVFIGIKGFQNINAWSPHLIGLAAGLSFLGLIFVVSRGRAMGMGDVKMAAALGFLFAWPKIVPLLMTAFMLGGLWATIVLLSRKKTLKDAIPFGPFLALAGVLVVIWGDLVLRSFYGFL
ncbi:MAG: Type 4 prepilin-like protein leader peptide-processing enzyme [Parcubacteria group bacterium GW2011_GWA2_47_8b]|uniref:Prepilin leader peptidase/N-methyltransferase n=3 Tax=Parcubacteria group TaxID=1794811 RepID=A0A0G1T5F6_9BACT|nr:MAG: Type 4 prepilin-like protein leader peptide-processing enzyme [Candidatus Giovannonibacteria bacterium GW2011_GWB1_47_6b]KKU85455.1 MAG: Type 4 prepilin-like protein leader peptide-processing enzyme [Parcubacteria group bacterium GW2011_GWA2_47_8b]KKU94787.1 MAG: Type 4 prepilin-like protein leader peptide-processing enzyme [Parcubacteria group bacterium GW2011_GWA1_48_11b]OGY64249.1 MAG: hypothetical protein A3E64_01230 [Candidatus Harrisonbacteria bacterium RIFCSPHIGHO2_12_FULL_48_16]